MQENISHVKQVRQVKYFHLETNSFEIDVTLTDVQLTVTLKDYIDWVLYTRIYTDNDIGVQIHRKVDLIDIFNSLNEQNFNNDQDRMKQKSNNNYTFGEVIKNGEVPSFKVQRGGKVTIYFIFLDMRTKKQVCYESNLMLKKQRDFTEMQIFTQKTIQQKKSYSKLFNKELQQLRKQNNNLAQRIKVLQNQKKQFNQLKEKVKYMEQILKQQVIEIKQIKLNLKEKEKLLTVKSKMSLKVQMFNENMKDKFVVSSNKIQYIGEGGSYTNFIFNQPIPKYTEYKFKIKMTKTGASVIMLGVVDSKKEKDNRSSYSSENAVIYQGCNGYKMPERKCEGKGFKQGQVVEMSVNLQKMTINWSVGGQSRATSTHQFLSEPSRIFMPYVEMRDKTDIIQIVQ